MLAPINLPPGIRNVGTPLATKGRWRDCNFVRWVEGVLQPVGKWVRITQAPLTGRVSGVFALRDDVLRTHTAAGTHLKCYVLTGSAVKDVTPADFETGYPITQRGGGFGAAEYGREEYGTAREAPTGLTLEAQSWSFDRWGEFLVATCISDGRAFVWDPGDYSNASDATLQVIPNAPEDNRALVVTNERHLMLIGAGGDPRRVEWSAREDYTTWTATATNLAGGLTLETSGILQTAVRVEDEVLVLSDTDVFSLNYVGRPYGYGREHVGTNCGVLSPRAVAVTNDFAVWMGVDGFYLYRGQIQQVDCDVWDFVFRDLNFRQRSLIACGHNSDFSEVWWFFPSGSSTANDRYVVWNYRENWWTIGYLPRTSWFSKGVLDQPVAAGEDGHLYEHEHDQTAAGAQYRDPPYIASAPFELGDGENVVQANMLIPDRDSVNVTALQFRFRARYAPRLPEREYGPYHPNETGYTPVRFSARQTELVVEARQDVDWRLGVLRVDMMPGGRR